jgi:hypothetical protein
MSWATRRRGSAGSARLVSVGRQDEAIRDLDAAVEELLGEIERCPDSDWHGVVPNGWTRAAIAMHCAMGNDVATAWIAYLVSGRDIVDTPDFHDRMNGLVAERTRMATKEEARALLRRSTDRAAGYFRSLNDEELDQRAHHGLAGRETTAGQFLPGLARHVRGHTEQFRAGL